VPVTPMAVDDRSVMRALNYARLGLGVTFVAVPRLALRLWPGPIDGATPATTAVSVLLARSVGGRDLALALGTLFALRHDAPVRGWLEAGVLADSVDAVAIVLALGHVRKGRALAAAASAVGAAVVGRRLVASLP